MADWEKELDRDDVAPLPVSSPAAPGQARPNLSRLSSRQRRQFQQPATSPTTQQQEDEDPFAVHSRLSQPSPPAPAPVSSSSSTAPQPFIHPLIADSFRPPQSAAQAAPSDPESAAQRLRDTLSRDPSTFQSRSHLPPLQRPVVPPLKLGDVIHKVLGPRALTNPSASPAVSNQVKSNLREKVARMRLHETVNPSLAPSADIAGLDADRAGYLDDGTTIEYDENDDDELVARDGVDAAAAAEDELRPLSPGKKTLPTSRLPIDPDDLARRPDELRGAPVTREELMHFRRNDATGGGVSSAAVTNNMVAVPKDASVAAAAKPVKPQLQDTFVESKTTGEFIRVRQPPPGENSSGANARGDSRVNTHNIHDFDHQIDTIIDSVNSIQSQISTVWLLMAGMLVGAALIQVYLVYLRTSDVDFLSYYSIMAGPARKVIYVLLGISVTVAWWRFSLERRDGDRHPHFITRYHVPNSHPWIWIRNLVCACAFAIGFLMTLIMVPVDDYIEEQWETDPTWYSNTTELPSFFTSRIDGWYAMAMVRLICVAIGWICIVHRFGYAEYHYLELSQSSLERPTGSPRVVSGAAFGVDTTGIPTSRSSRVSHRAPQWMTNDTAARMEPNASNMTIPARR